MDSGVRRNDRKFRAIMPKHAALMRLRKHTGSTRFIDKPFEPVASRSRMQYA
jgi:hypothetical protein